MGFDNINTPKSVTTNDLEKKTILIFGSTPLKKTTHEIRFPSQEKKQVEPTEVANNL